MYLKSLVNSYGLTKDNFYELEFEYRSVYEVKLDNGKIACRNKELFEKVDLNKH